jgi:hypothetical protein
MVKQAKFPPCYVSVTVLMMTCVLPALITERSMSGRVLLYDVLSKDIKELCMLCTP